MFKSPFAFLSIPKDVKVVFVQDFLLSDLIGGAELSMDALHQSSPVKIAVIRSVQLSKKTLEDSSSKHWVFGNFAQLDPSLIQYLSLSNISYSVYEHDYKFCRWRSVERHAAEGGESCHCESSSWGQLVESFYLNAKQLWFCSHRQMQRYFDRFPRLKDSNSAVLSATFGEEFFQKIVPIIQSLPQRKKSGWITLDSDSWIKGTANAKNWLESNNKQYSLIKELSPAQVLELMANSEGFVCLPRGADVSNRMVTEAKLLGCNIVTNDNVQHVGEEWFEHSDVNFTLQWLYNRREVFWKRTMELSC